MAPEAQASSAAGGAHAAAQSSAPAGAGGVTAAATSGPVPAQLLSQVLTAPIVPLRYSVAEASSFSGNYHPSNILVDKPHDLTSRWSGASVASMQSHGQPSGGGGAGAAPSTGAGAGAGGPSASSGSSAGAGTLGANAGIYPSGRFAWGGASRAPAASAGGSSASAGAPPGGGGGSALLTAAGNAREREGVSAAPGASSFAASSPRAAYASLLPASSAGTGGSPGRTPATASAGARYAPGAALLAQRRREVMLGTSAASAGDAAAASSSQPASSGSGSSGSSGGSGSAAATAPGALAAEQLIAANAMISAARERERDAHDAGRNVGTRTDPQLALTAETAGAAQQANTSASTSAYYPLRGYGGLAPPPAGGVPVGGSSGAASAAAAASASLSTSAAAPSKQYILLQLDKPAVVRRILFGKYHKAHPCNLADFKVYGWPCAGTTADAPHAGAGAHGKDNAVGADHTPAEALASNADLSGPSAAGVGASGGRWVRLLRAGLRNDNVKEEFDLRFMDEEGTPFACKYIKVVPLAAHQPKFNFSVWYIALSGVKEAAIVRDVALFYGLHAEDNATRLILKHLRERAHWKAFEALLASSGVANGVDAPLPAADEGGAGAKAAAALQKRPFEHPLLSHLFDSLVKRGSWDEAEAWLEKAAYGDAAAGGAGASAGSATLFSAYLSRTLPRPKWEAIAPGEMQSADGDDAPTPCGRGGHQMCIDAEEGIAYLFGGWDGARDLADFWAYHIKERRWRLISADVTKQNGPGPRSCHKLCYCPRTGFIYVLGKFVDPDRLLELAAAAAAVADAPEGAGAQHTSGSTSSGRAAHLLDSLLSNRAPTSRSGAATPSGTTTPNAASGRVGSSLPSSPARGNERPSSLWEADFYRFSTRTGQWTQLSRDTASEGGPKLLYDHQMLIDPDSQLLYVFGGRVIHPADPNRIELSGMYRFDVIANKWSWLFDDNTPAPSRVPSRVGHSMLLDTPPNGQRCLWIMSGQRGDRYLTDMWRYNIASGRCTETTRDYLAHGPHAGFTPRAAIDSKAREIYYFTGLVQRRNANERLRSSFWMYHIEWNRWSLLYEYGGFNSEVNKDKTAATQSSLALTSEARPLDLMDTDDDAPMDSGDSAQTPSEDGRNAQLGFDSSSVDEDMSSFFVRDKEPRPRYAAQMVYNPSQSAFYMFGGNPADPQAPGTRLDDFWQLTLERPSVADVLRQARFLVRQQRFYEMAKGGRGFGSSTAMQALTYLQTEVSAVVNHTDEGESSVFRKLMSHLITGDVAHAGSGAGSGSGSAEDVRDEDTPRARRTRRRSNDASSDGIGSVDDADMLSISQIIEQKDASSSVFAEGRPTDLYRQRLRLYNKLLRFFPADCCEPVADLSDAIALMSARAGGPQAR